MTSVTLIFFFIDTNYIIIVVIFSTEYRYSISLSPLVKERDPLPLSWIFLICRNIVVISLVFLIVFFQASFQGHFVRKFSVLTGKMVLNYRIIIYNCHKWITLCFYLNFSHQFFFYVRMNGDYL